MKSKNFRIIFVTEILTIVANLFRPRQGRSKRYIVTLKFRNVDFVKIQRIGKKND